MLDCFSLLPVDNALLKQCKGAIVRSSDGSSFILFLDRSAGKI